MTFPSDERSQTVPSWPSCVTNSAGYRTSFRERSRGKRFQNVFYLHHRYDRWNVSRSATGVKKERWSFRKTRKYMRDTSGHNRDVSTNLSKRGTRDTWRGAKGQSKRFLRYFETQSLLCLFFFFLFRLAFQIIFPPCFIYISDIFVSHLRLKYSFLKFSNLDRSR